MLEGTNYSGASRVPMAHPDPWAHPVVPSQELLILTVLLSAPVHGMWTSERRQVQNLLAADGADHKGNGRSLLDNLLPPPPT
jgi:hypothetical protein